MARIQAEQIVEHLEVEFRSALYAAVKEIAPDREFDRFELYNAFRRAMRRKFATWETVPDSTIER